MALPLRAETPERQESRLLEQVAAHQKQDGCPCKNPQRVELVPHQRVQFEREAAALARPPSGVDASHLSGYQRPHGSVGFALAIGLADFFETPALTDRQNRVARVIGVIDCPLALIKQ